MEIFLISRPDFFAEEISMLSRFMEAGNFTFHLRKPDSSLENLQELLTGLQNLMLKKTVLHEHYELRSVNAVKGIHLPEKIRQNYTLQQIKILKTEGLSVSTSFHKLQDLETYAHHFDYVFISPVFDSISKSNYVSSINLKEVAKVIRLTHEKYPSAKIIALGGISHDKIPILSETGFDGVAVLGSIWQDQDPLKALKKILNAAHQL